MLLESLSLKNIRSYTSLELEFAKGKTLLSGDIGSGKTTLLLAVEFALFGILRGEVSGGMLLRHGAREGEVCLQFSIDGKQYGIKRVLRRTKQEVKQIAGWFESELGREACTPIELKARVLEVIGYPPELVSKSKALIFRYTVYTPQEAMRKILYEDELVRMGIVRSLFDVDKYQRVAENARRYARYVRQSAAQQREQLVRIDRLHDDVGQLMLQYRQCSQRLLALREESVVFHMQMGKAQKNLHGVEEQRKEFVRVQSRVNALEEKQVELKHRVMQVEEQIRGVQDQMTTSLAISETHLRQKQLVFQNKLKALRLRDQRLLTEVAEAEAATKHAEQLRSAILQLDRCPTCKQVVGQEHKEGVATDQHQAIARSQKVVGTTKPVIEGTRMNIVSTEVELDRVAAQLEKVHQHQQMEKMQVMVKQQKAEFMKMERGLHEQLYQNARDLQGERAKLGALMQVEETYKRVKAEHQRWLDKVYACRERIAGDESLLQQVRVQLSRGMDDVKSLVVLAEKVEEYEALARWVDRHFVPLQEMLEQHTLARLRVTFEDTFKQWFEQLLDGGDIEVMIDEVFAPRIAQQGFDTTLENLSGGEKTSVALAYRLALNQVINVHHTLNTRDVLILDEPTDGFSSEQLARLGDVLQQLRIAQVVLVSHEPELEGFVDQTLRVEKDQGKSKVVMLS